MAGSLNKVFLLGCLGRDPEVKTTPSGQQVAKFSIATDESYNDKAGLKHSATEWHNIIAWGKLAEICQRFLRKGNRVHVEGKLKTTSWDKDGVKRYKTEVVASGVTLLDKNQEREPVADDEPFPNSPGGSAYEAETAAPGGFSSDDDLPF